MSTISSVGALVLAIRFLRFPTVAGYRRRIDLTGIPAIASRHPLWEGRLKEGYVAVFERP